MKIRNYIIEYNGPSNSSLGYDHFKDGPDVDLRDNKGHSRVFNSDKPMSKSEKIRDTMDTIDSMVSTTNQVISMAKTLGGWANELRSYLNKRKSKKDFSNVTANAAALAFAFGNDNKDAIRHTIKKIQSSQVFKKDIETLQIIIAAEIALEFNALGISDDTPDALYYLFSGYGLSDKFSRSSFQYILKNINSSRNLSEIRYRAQQEFNSNPESYGY